MLNSSYNFINLPSKSQGPHMSQEDRRILTLAGSVGDEAVNINISPLTQTVNYVTTSNASNSNWNWNLNYKLITHFMYIVCLKLIAFDIISVSMLTHATNISTSHINGSYSYLNSNISISSNITSDHDISITIGDVDDVLTYTTTAEDSSSSDADVFIIVYLVAVPVLGFGIVCVAAMMCKCDDNDHRDARDTEKQLSAAMDNNNNDEDNNEYEGWEEWNEEETSEWVKQLLINDNIDDDTINTFLQNDCPNMTGATMLKMKKNERLLKLFEQRGSNKSFAMFVAISAAIENLPWPHDENQENDQEDNDYESQDNNDNDDEDDEYYDV